MTRAIFLALLALGACQRQASDQANLGRRISELEGNISVLQNEVSAQKVERRIGRDSLISQEVNRVRDADQRTQP